MSQTKDAKTKEPRFGTSHNRFNPTKVSRTAKSEPSHKNVTRNGTRRNEEGTPKKNLDEFEDWMVLCFYIDT